MNKFIMTYIQEMLMLYSPRGKNLDITDIDYDLNYGKL